MRRGLCQQSEMSMITSHRQSIPFIIYTKYIQTKSGGSSAMNILVKRLFEDNSKEQYEHPRKYIWEKTLDLLGVRYRRGVGINTHADE